MFFKGGNTLDIKFHFFVQCIYSLGPEKPNASTSSRKHFSIFSTDGESRIIIGTAEPITSDTMFTKPWIDLMMSPRQNIFSLTYRSEEVIVLTMLDLSVL